MTDKSSITISVAEEGNKTAPVPKSNSYFTPWLLEAGSLLLSMACTLAVLAILHEYDGKPLPDWNGVTINGIISVLSNIANAALVYPIAEAISQLKWMWFWNPTKSRSMEDFEIFNRASRGPLGSIAMLFKPRLWHISTLGAILTVVAVTMQAFLQLMPAYVPRAVTSGRNASVASCDRYFVDPAYVNAVGRLDPGTVAALYNGVFASNDTPSVVISTCATGNCSWANYNSLGVCSTCADVNSLLRKTYGPNTNPEIPLTGLEYNWTVPGREGIGRYTAFVVSVGTSSLFLGKLQNYSIADITFLYGNEDAGQTKFPRPRAAFDCSLYWCMRSYSATMKNGTFVEKVISQWPSPSTSMEDLAVWRLPSEMSHAGGLIQYIPNDDSTASLPGTPFNASSTYYLHEWFLRNMQGAFFPYYSNGGILQQLSQSVPITGPYIAVDSIANSLTSYMRNKGTHPAQGDAFLTRIFVEVRWQWAILPLALLALSSAFLTTAATLSAIHKIPIWKSSSLPELVYGLNDTVASNIAATGPGVDEMEKATKQYNMAMTTDSRGLLFASHPKQSNSTPKLSNSGKDS